MLSPILFSMYLDGLLRELRRKQLGCTIAGCWVGAFGYADDLIVLAPNREVLQAMLRVREEYAEAHNLVFSIDPTPSKERVPNKKTTKLWTYVQTVGR